MPKPGAVAATGPGAVSGTGTGAGAGSGTGLGGNAAGAGAGAATRRWGGTAANSRLTGGLGSGSGVAAASCAGLSRSCLSRPLDLLLLLSVLPGTGGGVATASTARGRA